MAPKPATPTTTSPSTSTSTSTSSPTPDPADQIPASTLRTASIVATVLFGVLLILAILNFAIIAYKRKQLRQNNPYAGPANQKRGSFIRARGISRPADSLPPIVQITPGDAPPKPHDPAAGKEMMFATRSRSSSHSNLTVYIPQEQLDSTAPRRLSGSNVNLIPLHPASTISSTSRASSTHSSRPSSSGRYERSRTEDYEESDIGMGAGPYRSSARYSTLSVGYTEVSPSEVDERAQGLR